MFKKRKTKDQNVTETAEIAEATEPVAHEHAIFNDDGITEEAQTGLDDAERAIEREQRRAIALHAKYPWLVMKSIRKVPSGEVVDGVISKGTLAEIECTENNDDGTPCLARRTVNVQDIFQVRRCLACQAKHSRKRQQRKKGEAKASEAAQAAPATPTEETVG